MATPQVSGGNGVNLIDLANLLGGQKTSTTGNANVSLIGQLAPQLMNPADPSAQIAALFSAAQGQMPGLQAARANAVGARSGRNSGVVNAADKLQQDTILKAQQQIAQQEAQRQQTAAQLAASLANATRGTTTQAGTNLTRAGGVLGLLQAGSKFADSSLGKKAGTLFDQGAAQMQTVLSPGDAAGAEMYPGQASMESGQIFNPAFDFSAADWNGGSGGSSADFGVVDYSGSFTPDQGMVDYADEFNTLIGLADGGLIGRDDVAQRKIMAEYKPKGYADGGPVRASSAGGRVSSAPTYIPELTQRTVAQNINPRVQSLGFSGDSNVMGEPSGVADSTDTGVSGNTPTLGQGITMGLQGLTGNVMGMASTAANVAAPNSPAALGMQGLVALASQNPLAMISFVSNLVNSLNGSSSETGVSQTSSEAVSVNTEGALSSVPTNNSLDGPMSQAIDAANAAAASGDSGPGAAGGGAPGTGDSATGGNGGDAAGDGTAGAADGGHISGKGTGISDSIGIKVSKGEYVVPADVVAKMGTAFFDNLRAQFHVPAAMQALDTDDEDGDDVG